MFSIGVIEGLWTRSCIVSPTDSLVFHQADYTCTDGMARRDRPNGWICSQHSTLRSLSTVNDCVQTVNELADSDLAELTERPISLNDISEVVETLCSLLAENRRVVAAIAGPPGAGKSTFADMLAPIINERMGKAVTAIVPMDGFHLDNEVLDARGHQNRKGAPFTFDVDGLIAAIQRILASDADVAIPVFDRAQDLARAGGRIVTPNHQLILVEGNYLLLDESPWSLVPSLMDCRIYLEVAERELSRRLTKRWRDHGMDEADAAKRAETNDLPNARLVAAKRLPADYIVSAATS